MLSKDEVLNQSRAAFGQWEQRWRENCAVNGELYRKSGNKITDLIGYGTGRKLVCVACGQSLEDNIEVMKRYHGNGIDIICVDKALGILIDHGITPEFVIIADAGVSFEKYCEPYLDRSLNITLLSNINANTKWTTNWKGSVYFYVNKDNIESEKIFSGISGCKEFIPASSNVGNAVVVFATQLLGYDEYLLVGYDYCWKDTGNYYAFEDSDKRHWMKHFHIVDNMGELIQTSQNLLFSSRWMSDYYAAMLKSTRGMQVYNCSGSGILRGIPMTALEKRIRGYIQRPISPEEKMRIAETKARTEVIKAVEGPERLHALLGNPNNGIIDVLVRYIDKRDPVLSRM